MTDLSRIRMAFVEEQGNGRMCHESDLVARSLQRRGVKVELFTPKKIARRALSLAADTLVVGTIPVVQGALKQLGIEVLAPDDYPQALHAYLHRRTWRSTLRDVEFGVWEGAPVVFAKPADRLKSFTGRVFRGTDDLYYLGAASRRQVVWCSEVVEWRSEYRVYVLRDAIVSVDPYAGDPAVALDFDVVRSAVSDYRAAGAPCAYAIDFGVLSDGRTALIEANEGYGVGAYAIDEDAYADLLLARWLELSSAPMVR